MSDEMKNIYGDNVSWFCYEGSINLHENRDLKTFTLDDEFEVYGENEQGQEGSCTVGVINLLESAHVELDAKDARIAELEGALGNIEEYAMCIPLHFSGKDKDGEEHIDHFVNQILEHCKAKGGE